MTDAKAAKQPAQRKLRAVIEIDGGELRIFPLADNDAEAQAIYDALRFILEDFER